MAKNTKELSKSIGNVYNVTIDRPSGSTHPTNGTVYPINYGYVNGIIGGDGEEQDVYVLAVNKPINEIVVKIIAVVLRHDDNETKWIGVPIYCKRKYTKEEIYNQIKFMEQFFDSEIIM